MLIENMAGRTFPAIRFVAGDRLSPANFARALGITDPLLTSREGAVKAGYANRVVPPVMMMFLQVLPEGALERDLGFTWGRTLVAEANFEFGRVVTEDDVVSGQCTVEEAYERSGKDGVPRQFLRLRTEFSDEKGALVCRSTFFFIERKPVEAPA